MKDIDQTSIVSSDEVGIGDNEVVLTGWAPRGKRCHAQKKDCAIAKNTIRKAAKNITVFLEHPSKHWVKYAYLNEESYNNSRLFLQIDKAI